MRRFVPRYEVVFSGGVFYGMERILRSDITVFQGAAIGCGTLSLHEYVFFVEPHPCKTQFPASFALAKLVRAVTPLYLSNNSLCRPQINRAVQEVTDLARKNKDSIEGLAEEVGKFRV